MGHKDADNRGGIDSKSDHCHMISLKQSRETLHRNACISVNVPNLWLAADTGSRLPIFLIQVEPEATDEAFRNFMVRSKCAHVSGKV